MGRNQAQMIRIALVLWCWTLFLIFKETPSWILLKNILPPLKHNKVQVLEGAENPCSTN
jgi:hypothetical protein